jgi:hypothetical protein
MKAFAIAMLIGLAAAATPAVPTFIDNHGDGAHHGALYHFDKAGKYWRLGKI